MERVEKEVSDFTRVKLQGELNRLETFIEDTRLRYEQYFLGIIHKKPEEQYTSTRFLIKELLKAPFKNSADRYRLRMLINRFNSYATYWERVLKQMDNGTYVRDVFKAKIRENHQAYDNRQTIVRQSEKELINLYRDAFGTDARSSARVSYSAFKKVALQHYAHFKEKYQTNDIRLKAEIKEGKLVFRAFERKQEV